MEEVKDKMKGLMKKVNNPFSSSSSSSSAKFKGQGRVLGGGGSNVSRQSHNNNIQSKPNPPSKPSTTSSSAPAVPSNPRTSNSDNPNPNPNNKKVDFNPFDSLISPSKHGNSLTNVFECPICTQSFTSQEEVSLHIDTCLSLNDAQTPNPTPQNGNGNAWNSSELVTCVTTLVSGGASQGSIAILVKLLSNVVKDKDNVKFRKIRMGNPKIREAIGDVVGGVELLECVGFRLQEEGDEMWAVMDVPTHDHLLFIKKAISLLEPQDDNTSLPPPSPSTQVIEQSKPAKPQKIDRQVQVFFSVPESVASKIDVPDTFYNLSADELKREADARKKKIAESQLLIPKSLKEKQAKAARKRYKRTVIRIQFPDGVVLQGIFLPWEPTIALYEFVSSSLKEACLEFELWHPAAVKRRMIPRFPGDGERAATLDDEDLVPAALVKFKPIETDSVVFTGLSNQLLELSEPLN